MTLSIIKITTGLALIVISAVVVMSTIGDMVQQPEISSSEHWCTTYNTLQPIQNPLISPIKILSGCFIVGIGALLVLIGLDPKDLKHTDKKYCPYCGKPIGEDEQPKKGSVKE